MFSSTVAARAAVEDLNPVEQVRHRGYFHRHARYRAYHAYAYRPGLRVYVHPRRFHHRYSYRSWWGG